MPEDGPGKGPESSVVNSANSSSRKGDDSSIEKNPRTPQEKVCRYWISGNCVKGDACPFLHSWFQGVDFAMLAKLEGHKKVLFTAFAFCVLSYIQDWIEKTWLHQMFC